MAHTRSSFLASILAISALAVSAAATTIGDTVLHLRACVTEFAVYVAHTLRLLYQPIAGEVAERPTVARISAKAHALRQAKRQRPRIESTWRMCPSC